ncbi:MAG: FlgD immunoglobulin-like domain containing protein, partial [Vicinamibacteria bacterium]
LGSAHPNPTTGRVTIGYSLARQTVARMRVYSVAGRLIRTLLDVEQEAGPHEVVWDGRTNAGAGAGAGVYFYRLEAGGWSSEKKLIVLQR